MKKYTERNKKNKYRLLLILAIAIIISVAWLLILKLETEKPRIKLSLSSPYIGPFKDFSISVSDSKSGLRKIWVGLIKDGKETVLLDKKFTYAGFISGGKENEKSFKIKIEPGKSSISDGKAILRMVVWDYSWRERLHGNRTYIEKEIVIDTMSPDIQVLSRSHYISQGGAGLIIYRVSDTCFESGVVIDNIFFPGYSGYFKDNKIFMAFFALEYNQCPGIPVFLKATDMAGNNAKKGFSYHIRKKGFKKDKMNISNRFLNIKLPEFDGYFTSDSGFSMVDKFIKINSELRDKNIEKIKEITKKTENQIYWQGTFQRLFRSARKAGFGDHRTYRYNGRIIDKQVHLGVDLASFTHASVPAANKGKVAFNASLGIYGKTVFIDHGMGLYSMYAHLSSIKVQKGQIVLKGEIIGHTGSTGLAGGDHLHFSMLVNNIFVNPVEWWDASWINNNISNKIKFVKTSLN